MHGREATRDVIGVARAEKPWRKPTEEADGGRGKGADDCRQVEAGERHRHRRCVEREMGGSDRLEHHGGEVTSEVMSTAPPVQMFLRRRMKRPRKKATFTWG